MPFFTGSFYIGYVGSYAIFYTYQNMIIDLGTIMVGFISLIKASIKRCLIILK